MKTDQVGDNSRLLQFTKCSGKTVFKVREKPGEFYFLAFLRQARRQLKSVKSIRKHQKLEETLGVSLSERCFSLLKRAKTVGNDQSEIKVQVSRYLEKNHEIVYAEIIRSHN